MLKCGLAYYFDTELTDSLFRSTLQRVRTIATQFSCLAKTPRLAITTCDCRLRLIRRELPQAKTILWDDDRSWCQLIDQFESVAGTSTVNRWLISAPACLLFDASHVHQVLIELHGVSRVWGTVPASLALGTLHGRQTAVVMPSLAGVRLSTGIPGPASYVSLTPEGVCCGSLKGNIR